MILPFSAEISGAKQPYVTYAIIILCLLIHNLQDQNRGEIGQAASTYCASIYNPSLDEESLDVLRLDEYDCHDILSEIHSLPNKDILTDLLKMSAEENGEAWSDEELRKTIEYIEQHYDKFRLTTPESLDAKLSYDPGSFNPITSLLSALAHSDWWHVIGNLIFFFAFSATLELLIGSPLKYIGILVAIELACDFTYSLVSIFNGIDIPTLGLSGIVMGVIGLSAFMMPWVRIRTLVWILIHVRIYYIPAWMLASWFIGWDTYYLITETDNGGVNLVAHVSAGVAGYLIGMFWLELRKMEIQDELNDQINYKKCLRKDLGGSLSTYKDPRLAEENRQRLAESANADYKDRLYRLVQTHSSSEAILLILEKYQPDFHNIEIYKELFRDIDQWQKGRTLLCLGRLIISLEIANKLYSSALSIAAECLDAKEDFVLAESSQVLHLAMVAMEQHQYRLAYRLICNAGERYGDTVDVFRCWLLEVELLWLHLHNPEAAKIRISELLGETTNTYHRETMALANLMRAD